MQAKVFTALDEFDATVREYLERNPVENQILLANINRGLRSTMPEGALMATVSTSEGVCLVALLTPPFRLSLSHTDGDIALTQRAAATLAQALALSEISGVLGSQAQAEAFSQAYAGARGVRVGMTKAMHLHQLTCVVPPTSTAGILRVACAEEYPLILEWRERFLEDGGIRPPAGHTEEAVRTALREGNVYVWEDDTPVSTAVVTRPLKHGASISYVYTPPDRRKLGYASACVAALSQKILDGGARYCSLYTEADNPTSNHIYREIGYERIGSIVQIDFGED